MSSFLPPGMLDAAKRALLKAGVRAGATIADSLAGDVQRVAGDLAGKVGAGRAKLREVIPVEDEDVEIEAGATKRRRKAAAPKPERVVVDAVIIDEEKTVKR